MAFDPRQNRKRSNKLTNVRLTDQERMAVDWLTARLSSRAKEDYSDSDTVRVALGVAIKAEAEAARKDGESVPEAVRELLGWADN